MRIRSGHRGEPLMRGAAAAIRSRSRRRAWPGPARPRPAQARGAQRHARATPPRTRPADARAARAPHACSARAFRLRVADAYCGPAARMTGRRLRLSCVRRRRGARPGARVRASRRRACFARVCVRRARRPSWPTGGLRASPRMPPARAALGSPSAMAGPMASARARFNAPQERSPTDRSSQRGRARAAPS